MARPITSLRRLSHALVRRGGERVRGTDWWAVFVELLVVVVGILIAFELTNWGERRNRAAAERQLLERIEEEARGDFAAVRAARAENQQSAENYRLLTSAVSDPAAHAAYHRRGEAACNLLRLAAVPRASAGPGGLAAGERIELISDAELRKRLRHADARRTFSDRQLDFFRQSFQRYSAILEPHMNWSFGSNGEPKCGVDIDSLRADPAAVALLPKLYRDQRQFARYREAEMTSTRAVLERVRCLREGRCGS